MAAFARLLPPRLEHWIIRLLTALPAWLQRLIAGRPPRIEGHEVAPEVYLLLRLGRLVGERSLGGASVEEARAENRRTTAVTSGPPLPVGSVRELTIPGPAGPLRARLYRPAGAPAGELPLLVYFHGGGFVIGDLDTQDVICRFFCREAGTMVLSTDYRLAPEHPFPAAADDALAAFRWARDNAASLGADPRRLAVSGDSAGANLAAGVCLVVRGDEGPQPALQLLLYPVTDVVERRPSRELFGEGFYLTSEDMDWFEGLYLPTKEHAKDPRASILRVEDLSSLPPAYIATGGFDPLRDDGEYYAERLREAGNQVIVRRHPTLIHGFANLVRVSRASRAAMLEAAEALRAGLGEGAGADTLGGYARA